MAIATPCQTPGAVFSTRITSESITCVVQFPPEVRAALDTLSKADAQALEGNLHNAVELVLAPVWRAAAP